jgi:lipopolysaccharide/colanic/teichoic acid biosynthesis glycosyltransferase
MRVDAEDEDRPQWAREGDGRRLRVGAFMRKWNIDELPQFWNVLKCDMSLVGIVDDATRRLHHPAGPAVRDQFGRVSDLSSALPSVSVDR